LKHKLILIGVSALLLSLLASILSCAQPAAPVAETTKTVPTTVTAPAKTVTSAAQAEEKHEWTMQFMAGKGSPNFNMVQRFADSVNEASGGRLTIKLFGGGEIVPSGRELDAVLEGTLDASVNSPFHDEGVLGPASLVLAGLVPGLFDGNEFQAYLDVGGGMELIQKLYSAKGYDTVKVGLCIIAGPEPFGYFNKEINGTVKGIV